MKYVVFLVIESGDKQEVESFESRLQAEIFISANEEMGKTFSLEKHDPFGSEVIF